MNKNTIAEYMRIRSSSPDYPAKWALHYAKQWDQIIAWEKKFGITIEAEVDTIPVRGNAIASGNDDFDRKVEDEIYARLDSGDVWAWADVTVKVFDGKHIAESHLGGCCYESLIDFKRGGYYHDMIAECIAEIERLRG